MTLFAGQPREALREMYLTAWRKFQAGQPLTPLEAMIVEVIGLHREYHELLDDSDRARSYESVGGTAENPFLHMGLHLAIRDQAATDRPPGIRAIRLELAAQSSDMHGAEHRLMQVLAQTLWDAQRSGRAPDESAYLAQARKLLHC